MMKGIQKEKVKYHQGATDLALNRGGKRESASV